MKYQELTIYHMRFLRLFKGSGTSAYQFLHSDLISWVADFSLLTSWWAFAIKKIKIGYYHQNMDSKTEVY